MTVRALLILALLATACSRPPETPANRDQAMDEPAAAAEDRVHIDPDDDPRIWLERVDSEAALAWAREQNDRTYARLRDDPRYAANFRDALAIHQSDGRIPYGRLRRDKVYNFWEDADRRHGLWRRSALAPYLDGEAEWETLLDLDDLAAEEGRNWVWRGADCAPKDSSRCMLTLSDGGTDSAFRREFDRETRRFVSDGFVTPEVKGGTTWIDEDTLLVMLATGPEDSTASGYAKVVRRWHRGTPLAAAEEVLRGKHDDVSVSASRLHGTGGEAHIVIQARHTFYETSRWVLTDEGELVPLPLPRQASLRGLYHGQLLVSLNESWSPEDGHRYEAGTLLSFDLGRFLERGRLPEVHVAFTPGERQSLRSVGVTSEGVVLAVEDNVIGALLHLDLGEEGWHSRAVPLSGERAVNLVSADPEMDLALFAAEGFLEPPTLYHLKPATLAATPIRSAPTFFDADGLTVTQREVTSRDGTLVPYFLVHREGLPLDGSTPVLLFAYGGFQVSMRPSYSGVRGRLWLEQGGAYALANLRGGGEFGPAWHQAGLKTNRQRIYDDLIGVAEDLIESGVTSPRRLAVDGRSNGGLLTGVMYTQRPDLFGAVISGVPLLDMLRYHLLLAGASWVGEYGHPDDPEEGAFLRSISPYHNVRRGGSYPKIMLYTSTKDDRVHPGHARKFAHLLEELGHPYLYYENIEGGHAGSANLEETAHRDALLHVFLQQQLMD